MTAVDRNNVRVSGRGNRVLMFAHGFGCDQAMWRLVTPFFTDHYRVVLFDLVGAGRSDLSAYSKSKYSDLQGYADDVIEIIKELGVDKVVFIGHSVSAMIGALASIKVPASFESLIMIGPSPRYIDDAGYVGGFTAAQIDELLDFLDANHLGWAETMAPTIMGNSDRPALGAELTESFCRTDPAIAKHFARTFFTSDNRADLSKVEVPTLVLQCSNDVIAPVAVGEFVHAQLRNSRFVQLQASGHCPNLSAPEETAAAIQAFL